MKKRFAIAEASLPLFLYCAFCGCWLPFLPYIIQYIYYSYIIHTVKKVECDDIYKSQLITDSKLVALFSDLSL